MRKKVVTPDWERWQAFIRQHGSELGLSVTEAQARLFAGHAAELAGWNKKINLTSITDPMEMAVKHFLDSLAPSQHIPENATLLDVGTGGGFPGIPLKIFNPSLAVTLIDATQKKINFVRQVIAMLALENATALHGRVEALKDDPHFAAGFDTVICRAFGSLAAFVSSSYRLVRKNGRLIAMKGRQIDRELEGLNALRLPVDGRKVDAGGLFTVEVHKYTLPVLGDQRSLIILTAK